jgi:S1-C subfamily serine protease
MKFYIFTSMGINSLMIGLLISLFNNFGVLSLESPQDSLASSVKPELLAENYQKSQRSLSKEQIRAYARLITVKVLNDRGQGSGIIVRKQGRVYTVLTNAHVIKRGNSFQIKTFDGLVHSATVNSDLQFAQDDLAVMQFRSSQSYQVAKLGLVSSLKIGDETFAAGFPADKKNNDPQGFEFNTGKVGYLLSQPFTDGYQIGYSNNIYMGMSGGPVLNHYGELVGVNGRRKYPLWGNNYIFQDGSIPIPEISEQMDKFSWAIPVQTVLKHTPQLQTSPVSPFRNDGQPVILVSPFRGNTRPFQESSPPSRLNISNSEQQTTDNYLDRETQTNQLNTPNFPVMENMGTTPKNNLPNLQPLW